MSAVAATTPRLSPSFKTDSLLAPGPKQLNVRRAYYHLVNVEEHPELLPLVHDEVERRLECAQTALAGSPLSQHGGAEERLAGLIDDLAERRGASVQFDALAPADIEPPRALHYFTQYMPTAFVDGCWLQNAVRVSTAHTRMGAILTGLYQHQAVGSIHDPVSGFVADYRTAATRLGLKPADVSSYSFAESRGVDESAFILPLFLLSIAQFPRSFMAEIVGVNLAWQCLGAAAFGPQLVRNVCKAFELPPSSDDGLTPEYFERSREMAIAAVDALLKEAGGAEGERAWNGLLRGVFATIEAVTQWRESAQRSMRTADPRQQMIELMREKAPHAIGYHGSRMLGSRRLDDHFQADRFDGEAVLDALAQSVWVKAGKPDKSALLGRLISFGGPMIGVFSPAEQQIIRNWIDSLPEDEDAPEAARRGRPAPPSPVAELRVEGRSWDAAELNRRSKAIYRKCTVRELYHRLVNIEFHPDILPVAERYATDLLERSMASLTSGDRPIPSLTYQPAALREWVYAKHREQVDSYRPPDVLPKVAKEAFIEANLQLAPLILIDGGWLQGIASPALIHTPVGRILFHIFIEEIGEGRAERHHANIYRDLLDAMGVHAPPVESWEFASWDRLQDEAFVVPTFWLAISCFPRHFLPEILGMNLAVELAGVGGPYMEARDTLRRLRYPTLFVDVHNAADNVTAGHAALAMQAIEMHLDEVIERDGPHNVDRVWHRVWSGVRATLPQIGHGRLIAHRIRQRIFAETPKVVPLIFPS